MTMALDKQNGEMRIRATREQALTAPEVLEKAHSLALQIERLLTSPACQTNDSDAFRVRMARAHTLSLLDQLAELIETSDSHPSVRNCAPSEEPARASGVRQVRAWR